MKELLHQAGYEILKLEKKFGSGQYLCCLARYVGEKKLLIEDYFPNNILYQQYIYNSNRKINEIEDMLKKYYEAGKKVVVWCAAAKGVTFANLFDKDKKYISYYVDMNPTRNNTFIPGTGHGVYGNEYFENNVADVVILMNEVYKSEVRKRLEGFHVQLICIDELIICD